ncbi:MAG: protein-(glutamine-N5) methyltransferase, release factor-specific [Chloroflexi bacterium]|nr:protein-(glutamine-N5) methyltransferase, release factor-specific [Chloroflexota bacterium]|tara:strand:+ start:19391 stop:20236 length:846 start_codon:yes stop_codon:yes gene_type:complete
MMLRDYVLKTNSLLKNSGFPEYINETRILISYYMKWTTANYISNLNYEINNENISNINKLIERRIQNEPIQYITQSTEFYKRKFFINSNVLIPRNETELLVIQAIDFIKKNKIKNPKILDICTGSGVVGISLGKEIPFSNITVSDISSEALEIAKINAKKHKLNINFILSDCLKNIYGEFNIIVSNPPYIKTNNLKFLDEEIKKEPKIALNGGPKGTKIIEKILEDIPRICKKNKYGIFIEIDPDLKENCIEISEKYFPLNQINLTKDLNGLVRNLVIKNL